MVGFLAQAFLRFLVFVFVFSPEVYFGWVFGRGVFEVFVLFVFRSFVQKFILIGFLVKVFFGGFCFVCF